MQRPLATGVSAGGDKSSAPATLALTSQFALTTLPFWVRRRSRRNGGYGQGWITESTAKLSSWLRGSKAQIKLGLVQQF
ncbi:hypothetical protein BaRGS_00039369 [Batillaria attramentaria]|uniref:Uncharacterized protein n=1 Tax=Batillaria attramentaria TaxID=370345 RepID=A0ABD0J3B2_9CAEN